MIEPEIRERVGEILNHVAGDKYESWNRYWIEHDKAENHIIEILEAWVKWCNVKRNS